MTPLPLGHGRHTRSSHPPQALRLEPHGFSVHPPQVAVSTPRPEDFCPCPPFPLSTVPLRLSEGPRPRTPRARRARALDVTASGSQGCPPLSGPASSPFRAFENDELVAFRYRIRGCSAAGAWARSTRQRISSCASASRSRSSGGSSPSGPGPWSNSSGRLPSRCPVGGTRPLAVDLRVVAATNRDLGQRVREGTFRSDLLARLSGLRLKLPPLRERREDLGPLVRPRSSKCSSEVSGRSVLEQSALLVLASPRDLQR